MKIVNQSVEILDLGFKTIDQPNCQYSAGEQVLAKLEKAGRTCYKSEDKITGESAEKFIRMLLKRGHESVLEHHNITIKFITDRGVTHEMVRHRIASYSQESTRYCNYAGKDMEFILPVEFYDDLLVGVVEVEYSGDDILVKKGFKNTRTNFPNLATYWLFHMITSENKYVKMINHNCAPQLARSVLPNSLKTEIVMTANLREWRHFFKLRCAKAAHPQMRELAWMALNQVSSAIPIVFEDLWEEHKND